MSRYTATIAWERAGADFVGGQYSRAHLWRFDGGLEVAASSSPHSVPLPYSDAAAVDPEEAFVASLASCHMLWFLDLARRRGLNVDGYTDEADGLLAKDAEGRLAMTVVTLRPRVRFAGATPAPAEFRTLHHQAHERCFIAASVRSEVRCEPVLD